MTGKGTRTRKSADSLLVALLAGGATIRKAAEKGGVAVATVNRRLKNPEFRKRVDDARRAAFGRALARLSSSATLAALVLHRLATKAESEKVRCTAARSILELAVRLEDHVELSARVAALEEMHEQKTTPSQKGGARNGFPVHSAN